MRHAAPYATFAVALAALVCPAPAAACSYALVAELNGYPSDGDTEVPIDAVPIYVAPGAIGGDTAGWVASASLTSAAAEVIALTPRDVEGTHFSLVPERPLRPETAYTLRVTWAPRSGLTSPGQNSLTFQTGSGPAQPDTSAPRASIAHYSSTIWNTCSAGAKSSCISLTDDFYLWQFVGDDTKRISRGSFTINMFGFEQGHPFDCIVLRRRAPNGQLGDASTICTQDGLMFDLTPLEAGQADLSSPAAQCDRNGLTWQGTPLAKRLKGGRPAPYDDAAPEHFGSAEPMEQAALDSDTSGALASRDAAGSEGCSTLPTRVQHTGALLSLLAWLACALAWRRRCAR